MSRIHISQAFDHAGQSVQFSGFVETIRKQGGIIFVILRDITGTIQAIVLKSNTDAFSTLSSLSLESVVTLSGTLASNSQAPGGIELVIDTIKVLSVAEPELPIPVDQKGESETNLDTRLDWRQLDLRKPRNSLIFKIWTLMDQIYTNHLTGQGFIQIHSPKLMNTPSESGAELFTLDYFGKPAYLSQSPQFYKQMAMASGFEKIFEIGSVFRADPSFTPRHGTEFIGYDLEVSYIESHHDIMTLEENLLVDIISQVSDKYGPEIKTLFGRDLPIPQTPFPRITFAKAKQVLAERGIKSDKPADMTQEEETELSKYILEEYGHEFVFVIDYPVAGRPFYHMRHPDDDSLTKSFDLLWSGLEITTGAQREHRYEVLKSQATDKGLNLQPINDYLNFFRYGCPPHGGFGAGPSRIIMKILGLDNIREATYIYRGVKRITP
jgi:nondiscriminating aspartyl-tRNA synthetase